MSDFLLDVYKLMDAKHVFVLISSLYEFKFLVVTEIWKPSKSITMM